ncbi:MAG: nucleoside triphosphate pyrophosphohydrolase [Clostridia bacterium]|nr:nucleoside triphosphate pyrophosphohydrolase [Clostridia bacterium]
MENTVIHNKLVRDRIPDIVEKSGNTPVCRTLAEDEYLEMLDKKLSEELNEYFADKSMEEIADLLEVIHAVVTARGFSMEDVEKIRLSKKEKRGGFEKRIFLEKVIHAEV